MLEVNQIYNQDCIEGLEQLDSESCSLVISSPPYKNKDGFSYSLMNEVFEQLYRVQKNNSLFFLNFGHLKEEKMRPFNVCGCALGVGYKLNDTIIWVKTQFSPIQGKKRLNNLTEFIFLLYKGKMPDLDRLSIGVPYEDLTNAKRYNNGVNLRCQGNMWKFGYETIQRKEQKLHSDLFPLELPTRCIKLSNISQRSLVLDPFAGSATTCLAAQNLGMNYIGFEINKYYWEIGRKRLNQIDFIPELQYS